MIGFVPNASDQWWQRQVDKLVEERDEARGKIEALEKENFALSADLCDDGYGDEWGNHQCRRVDAAVKEAEYLAIQLATLAKERDRMREALMPFDRVLSILEALPGGFPVKPEDEWDTGIRDYMPGAWPTFSDLRAVRAALGKGESK